MNNQPLTPLEKLLAEKSRIRSLTKKQEAKINEHFTYVQANAGNLFLSFISSMLFKPSSKEKKEGAKSAEATRTEVATEPFSFADLLPMTKLLGPVVWEVTKPILLSWSIKKASTFVAQLFTRKKRHPNN